MRWDFVYEEEHFDVNGYCCAGILTDGKGYLFFTVSCDIPGGMEICRIYSSIAFSPESLECQYLWTAENDELLLNCLNNLGESEPYSGENGPLRKIDYVSPDDDQ